MLISTVTGIEMSHNGFECNRNIGVCLRGITKEQIQEMLDKYAVVIIRRQKMKKDRDFMILDAIDHLTANGLDDQEVEILQNAIKEIKEIRYAQWKESMESARKIVESWPKWKQEGARSMLR